MTGAVAVMASVAIAAALPLRRGDDATFSINPTQIFLSSRAPSALVSLRNDSTEPLRFQLSAFAWAQSPSGEMHLEPTEDIVVFPLLLTLGPSEERRVRVGGRAKAAADEQTYRLFVEELPPLERSPEGSGVRVLTRMGIPIFLQPAKPIVSAALADAQQAGGRLRFTLRNTGTVHFVPQAVRVQGLAGKIPVFERQLDSWYVLAGGRRDFELPLPIPDCACATTLVVEVELPSGRVTESVPLTPAGCPR